MKKIKKYYHFNKDEEFKELMKEKESRYIIVCWNNKKKLLSFSFGKQEKVGALEAINSLNKVSEYLLDMFYIK